MDLRKVKKLIELLEESDISEIEVHEGEESVRISRHSNAPAPTAMTHHVSAPAASTATTAAGAGQSETGAGDAQPALADGEEVVTAPIIGTFYRAAAPGKPPFVEEGDPVKAGQTLCIIEAMKMMNRIEVPTSGVLKKILVEDADPVEYGQTIAIIQT